MARNKTIPEIIHARMIEHNIECLAWGDTLISEIAGGLFENMKYPHPLTRMGYILDAMERRPDLFEKKYLRGHDRRYRSRKVRIFYLKKGEK